MIAKEAHLTLLRIEAIGPPSKEPNPAAVPEERRAELGAAHQMLPTKRMAWKRSATMTALETHFLIINRHEVDRSMQINELTMQSPSDDTV